MLDLVAHGCDIVQQNAVQIRGRRVDWLLIRRINGRTSSHVLLSRVRLLLILMMAAGVLGFLISQIDVELRGHLGDCIIVLVMLE